MTLQRVHCFVLIASLSLSCFCMLGCGAQGQAHFPAGGSVRFEQDGTSATFGDIEFRSEEDPVVVARGKIQKDGTFTVNAGNNRGTVAGWHTVVILQPIRSWGA